MLAIHISRDTLKYAQLVSFKGVPFVESLGKISIKAGLQIQNTTNAEVTRNLAEQIASIRNSAEFPDNSTHLVIDSDWFPVLLHGVDGVLSDGDIDKYLAWRMSEMLDNTASQFRIVHQKLADSDEQEHQYLSLGIPKSFDSWIEKVMGPSDLEVNQVIMDIQALGDLLSASGQLDPEGGIQVILENQQDAIRGHIYENQDFKGYFSGSFDSERSVTLDLVQGDRKWIRGIVRSVERALQGRGNPDNVLTTLFFFTSTGDTANVNNLNGYKDSCKPLDLHKHFNFRDPEFNNIDEYAVVLGALSPELSESIVED